MRRFAGSCRFVYNKALALQQERHKAGEKKLGYAALCKALIEWKAGPETLWLNEAPSQALQQTLKNLERAYKNFFEKRADFPRFKKKGQSDSFRYPQGIKLDQVLPAMNFRRELVAVNSLPGSRSSLPCVRPAPRPEILSSRLPELPATLLSSAL